MYTLSRQKPESLYWGMQSKTAGCTLGDVSAFAFKLSEQEETRD